MKRGKTIVGIVLIGGAAWAVAAVATRPPVPPDLDRADPEVQRLIESRAQTARLLPAGPRAWRKLGLACEANDFDDAATAAYERSLRLWPRSARTWYRLAIVRQRSGATEAALAALTEAQRLAPAYAPLWWREGDLHLAGGRFTEAEAAYMHALSVSTDAEAATFGLARVALMRGEWQAVIDRLSGWQIDLGPNAAYAHLLRGRAYQQLGKTGEARLELARGKAGLPAFADPWSDSLFPLKRGRRARTRLADDLLGQGRTKEAVRVYRELHEAFPDDPHVASNFAVALLAADEIEAAEAVLRAAEINDPDHFGVQLNLATTLARGGRLEPALIAANRAVELNPSLGAAFETRGAIEMRLERPDAALADFDHAARLDAKRVDALVWAAVIHQERGDDASALDLFRRAAQRDPARFEAWLGQALTNAALGATDDAADALEVARELDPEHPMVKRLSRQIPAGEGNRP